MTDDDPDPLGETVAVVEMDAEPVTVGDAVALSEKVGVPVGHVDADMEGVGELEVHTVGDSVVVTLTVPDTVLVALPQ